MNGLRPNYSLIIVSLLNHAWKEWGPFTLDNSDLIARWVQTEMNRIKESYEHGEAQPPKYETPAKVLGFQKLVHSGESEDGWS